jgi:hypothetical protein
MHTRGPALLAACVVAACGGSTPAPEPAAVGNAAAPPVDAGVPDAGGDPQLEAAIETIRRRVHQQDVVITTGNPDPRPRELCLRVLPVGPDGAPVDEGSGVAFFTPAGEPCACVLGDRSFDHGERFRAPGVECTCEAGTARRCAPAESDAP